MRINIKIIIKYLKLKNVVVQFRNIYAHFQGNRTEFVSINIFPVSKVEEITEEMPLETDVNVTEGIENIGVEE